MRVPGIFIIIFVVFFTALYQAADKPEYSCDKIPAALLVDAKSVTRDKKITFEIVNNHKAIQTVKHVVTILKQEDRKQGIIELFYDKFVKIDNLEGAIYNSRGEKVRSLDSDEIKDYSASGENTLYSDSRVKVVELYYDNYPYTIEYEYTIYFYGYLNWPEWTAQPTLEPVEHTQFEVLIDNQKELRHWCNKDTLKPKISNIKGQKKYFWEAGNLPKLSEDIVGDDYEDFSCVVKIAPEDFEIDDHAGNMKTWDDFAKWTYSLYSGKDNLPENARNDVAALFKAEDTMYDRIRKVFTYMQKRTRYVSIQLGIGGWMPNDASFVHEKGYGDCKALVNYMCSLLKSAGIPSYPALIHLGGSSRPLIFEFPSNQFNHVVLCVPVNSDTLWLECTSQFIPMGLIHKGIIDRYALLLTPQGGKTIHTPSVKPEANLQLRNSYVSLNNSGNSAASIVTQWKGIPRIDVIEMYNNSSLLDREKWVQEEFDIANNKIKNFNFYGIDSSKTETRLTASLDLWKYASATGTRLFFLPNLTERRKRVPPDIKNRIAPIRFTYPYKDIDTVVFSIPDDFKPESLPNEVTLKSSFANFHSKSELKEGKIVFTRTMELYNCTIPAASYQEYKNFMASIVKADKAQVILVKK